MDDWKLLRLRTATKNKKGILIAKSIFRGFLSLIRCKKIEIPNLKSFRYFIETEYVNQNVVFKTKAEKQMYQYFNISMS